MDRYDTANQQIHPSVLELQTYSWFRKREFCRRWVHPILSWLGQIKTSTYLESHSAIQRLFPMEIFFGLDVLLARCYFPLDVACTFSAAADAVSGKNKSSKCVTVCLKNINLDK